MMPPPAPLPPIGASRIETTPAMGNLPARDFRVGGTYAEEPAPQFQRPGIGRQILEGLAGALAGTSLQPGPTGTFRTAGLPILGLLAGQALSAPLLRSAAEREGFNQRSQERAAAREASRLKMQETAAAQEGQRVGALQLASVNQAGDLAVERAKALAKAKEKPAVDPQAYNTVANRIQQDPQYQDVLGIAQGWQRVRAGAAQKDTAGDLAIIFGYMKLLDPRSTVREGEQASASNAGGVPAWVQAKYNEVLGGGKLGQDQRDMFVRNAEAQYRSVKPTYDRASARWKKVSESLQVPWDLVNPELTAIEGDVPQRIVGYNPAPPEAPATHNYVPGQGFVKVR